MLKKWLNQLLVIFVGIVAAGILIIGYSFNIIINKKMNALTHLTLGIQSKYIWTS